MYAWGYNGGNQLGYSSQSYPTLKSPSKVLDLKDVIIRKIVCGSSYVLAISDVSELFSWGYNSIGQLGLGDTTSRYKPTKIEKIGKYVQPCNNYYVLKGWLYL